jgi:3-oxoacyl-[acyl-carrier protein] reductase
MPVPGRTVTSVDLELEGKTALVFGAGGGIGAGIVASLAKEGVRVAAADISAEALSRVVSETAGVVPIELDLSKHDTITAGVERAQQTVGAIDILVNNTGGPPPGGAIGVSAGEWERHFHTMVTSLIHATDLVLPGMLERQWGRILTSTSYGVIAPIPNLAISNALRPALLGWSKSLASEVAARGVTVNVVVPGRLATRRTLEIDQKQSELQGVSAEEVARASTATIPAARYGSPAEYADVVTFLASVRASYVTGSVIRVDGGMIQSIF